MSSSDLKIIAMLTMVIDHVGYVFFPEIMWFRIIGRIALPLYAFLMAEGFSHIKRSNRRCKEHIVKLVILFFLSIAPFSYMIEDEWFTLERQNVILTLLIGFLALWIADKTTNKFVKGLIYVASMALALALKTDYASSGVFLIIAFYYYLNNREKRGLSDNLSLLFFILANQYLMFIAESAVTSYGSIEMFGRMFMLVLPWTIGVLASAPIIMLYNGELGNNKKWFKWVYSSFYPLHMAIIDAILVLTSA